MSPVDLTFCIGGEAGQGVESTGLGFTQALTAAGLHAIGVPDYYSRIRGGHNFFTIRASDGPVYAIHDSIHILLALNAETIERHVTRMEPGGAVIVDEGVEFDPQLVAGYDVGLVRAPLASLAEAHGGRVMLNTAALAVACALVDFDLTYVFAVVDKNFGSRSAAIAAQNRAVAQAAFDWARAEGGGPLAWKLAAQAGPELVAIDGNQAFAIGSEVAGCQFVAGYPMTPATSVLVHAAQHAAEWGLVVKHAEDEIAAMNMVIGAAHAGVRAMVPTSGGGYDLMTEGTSLAGMTETPIVVYLSQRPGPATGLATRTGQGDLMMALFSSHGEFPRAVLAPHTPEEAFDCAVRAFNLAEKYQCVVIVLSDQYNASTVWGRETAAFDFDGVEIDRGKMLTAEDLEAIEDYQRFALTDDGISPRARPGLSPKAVYPVGSDEHEPDGHISEEADVVVAMYSKRMRKIEGLAAEMRPPLRFGPAGAAVTLVTWGSTYGAAFEAMEVLNARGQSANLIHFVDLWPFPAEAARAALADARRTVVVEGNAGGQFAYLLKAETGIIAEKLPRFDGRPITPEYILQRLEVK